MAKAKQYNRIVFGWQGKQSTARVILPSGRACECCYNRIQHECNQRGLDYKSTELWCTIQLRDGRMVGARALHGIARDLDLPFGFYHIFKSEPEPVQPLRECNCDMCSGVADEKLDRARDAEYESA